MSLPGLSALHPHIPYMIITYTMRVSCSHRILSEVKVYALIMFMQFAYLMVSLYEVYLL